MNIIDATERVRWDALFRILSMERSYPFFDDMGLPLKIVNNPQKITSLARLYYQNIYSHNETFSGSFKKTS